MLLTRAPLYLPLRAFAFDLHVLGTPPALILSQDQTLNENLIFVLSFRMDSKNLIRLVLHNCQRSLLQSPSTIRHDLWCVNSFF